MCATSVLSRWIRDVVLQPYLRVVRTTLTKETMHHSRRAGSGCAKANLSAVELRIAQRAASPPTAHPIPYDPTTSASAPVTKQANQVALHLPTPLRRPRPGRIVVPLPLHSTARSRCRRRASSSSSLSSSAPSRPSSPMAASSPTASTRGAPAPPRPRPCSASRRRGSQRRRPGRRGRAR